MSMSSLPIAVANCGACNNLYILIMDRQNSAPIYSDSLLNRKNKAMEALEVAVQRGEKGATAALHACTICNYGSQRIVECLEKEGPEELKPIIEEFKKVKYSPKELK